MLRLLGSTSFHPTYGKSRSDFKITLDFALVGAFRDLNRDEGIVAFALYGLDRLWGQPWDVFDDFLERCSKGGGVHAITQLNLHGVHHLL